MTNIKEALREFCIHIVVGAIAFVVLALIAVSISFFVSYLDNNGVNPNIIKGLTGFEYFLFGMDLFLGGIFVLISMFKLVRELWK